MSLQEAVGIALEMEQRKEQPPLVKFYREAVKDGAASKAEGRIIHKDVDMVNVHPVGGKDDVDYKVDYWFEVLLPYKIRLRQMPSTWLDRWRREYEAWKDGQELPLEGTPIRGWALLTPAQQEHIVALGIKTVEVLSTCNDEAVRRIGMGGVDLKNKAKAWIQQANDRGGLVQEISDVRKTNEKLEQQNTQLQEQMALLQQQMNQLNQLPQQSLEQPSPLKVVASTTAGGTSEIQIDDILGKPEPPKRGKK